MIQFGKLLFNKTLLVEKLYFLYHTLCINSTLQYDNGYTQNVHPSIQMYVC